MEIKEVVVTGKNEVELQSREGSGLELGKDEVFIRTEYSFISAGTELANYTANTEGVYTPGSWCAYPWKSGYANVGIVQEIGEDVTVCDKGQRVFSFGPHASFIKQNQQSMIIEVQEGIDPKIAAASRMAGVALTSVIVSEIEKNGWVVIFGLGMVGNIAAQAFQILGCRVIGIDPTKERRELAQRCGIPHTVGGNPEEVFQEVMRITGGKRADISIDAVGNSSVVMQALQTTANHGQLILLGTPRAPVNSNITEFLGEVHARFITIRGALEWGLPHYSDYPGRDSHYSKQQMIFDWIQRGKLKLEPLISHVLQPSKINEAYEGLLYRPDIFTGVVLDWTRDELVAINSGSPELKKQSLGVLGA